MDIANILMGGLGGAVISATVTYWVFLKSRKLPSGKAYEILKQLHKRLKEPEGEYYFAKSADDNYGVARDIYALSDGEIVATAFHENPEKYGENDLVRSFKYGSLFTRITAEEVCSGESLEQARRTLQEIRKGASLVIVPKGEAYTRIDGIFCHFHDDTYLSFVSFRDPDDPSRNRGVIFRDGIAESFFNYYNDLAEKHSG